MRITIFILSVIIVWDSYSQGCSDAGFCTMGAMKPDQNYSKRLNLRVRSIEYNFYRGLSNITPVIFAHTIEVNTSINNNSTLQFKLPYMIVEGNLGNTSGLGDISLSYTKFIKVYKGGQINGTLGVKIPLGNSDVADGTRDFPMYYQPSLGSFDIIAGGSWINSKWLLATGLQVALTANGNEFRYEEWPDYPDQEYLRKNNLATQLKRGTDVMFRVERNFRFVNFNFTVGLLPIYRITKDQILDEQTGEYVKVDKTTGLAMSGLFSGGYSFNAKNAIKLILGYKITDRKENPDGLTRRNVQSVSFIHKF
jgi:hypothetical protein